MAEIKWKSEESTLEEIKLMKINELKQVTSDTIIHGFDYEIKGKLYHFSYSMENQINFQDTDRLFLNDNIKNINWNAYLNGEKIRIPLDKEIFTIIYLEGVKHKQNCLDHLHNILIPKIEEARTKEEVDKVVWGKQANVFNAENKNIGVQVQNLAQDAQAQKSINEQTESIILEIADIALTGGF